MTINYAERARALVGTRFRPQGRSVDGLDCVGVILASFDLSGTSTPTNYSLRGDHFAALRRALELHFRRIPQSQLRPGDVMMLKVADDQAHLGIRTQQGFVHAHAGLRRVVETPGMPEWRIVASFRRRRTR